MSSGRSPELTRQFTETESSKFAATSPKSKCAILGATSDIDWEGYNNLGFSKQNYEIKTIIINIVGT